MIDGNKIKTLMMFEIIFKEIGIRILKDTGNEIKSTKDPELDINSLFESVRGHLDDMQVEFKQMYDENRDLIQDFANEKMTPEELQDAVNKRKANNGTLKVSGNDEIN